MRLCAQSIGIPEMVGPTQRQGTLADKCGTAVWLPSSFLGKVSDIPARRQNLLHRCKSLIFDFLQADHVSGQGGNMAREGWLPPWAGQHRRWGSWIPRWRDIGLRQDIVGRKRERQGGAPHTQLLRCRGETTVDEWDRQ